MVSQNVMLLISKKNKPPNDGDENKHLLLYFCRFCPYFVSGNLIIKIEYIIVLAKENLKGLALCNG